MGADVKKGVGGSRRYAKAESQRRSSSKKDHNLHLVEPGGHCALGNARKQRHVYMVVLNQLASPSKPRFDSLPPRPPSHTSSCSSINKSILLEKADLCRMIPENARKLTKLVEYDESRVELGTHSVFVREARPPDSHYIKASVLFLHGQSFTSSTWLENDMLKTFAALGYRSIAIDLPGSGQTRGGSLQQHEKANFLIDFIETIGLKQVMIVSASMSFQYIIPLLTKSRPMICLVAVAPSNTHQIRNPAANTTPTLVVWGDRDTSLGPTSAENLRKLPNVRLQKIPNAGHACYLQNPTIFESICVNFFELIRNYN